MFFVLMYVWNAFMMNNFKQIGGKLERTALKASIAEKSILYLKSVSLSYLFYRLIM